MFPPSVLFRYLARHFLVWFLWSIFACTAVLLIGDLTETIRRTAHIDSFGIVQLFSLIPLKLPSLLEQGLPFAILFGSIGGFLQLSHSRELVVIRACGISVWQFLLSPLLVALGIGLFMVGLFNPFSATLMREYEVLENQYIKGQTNLFTVSDNGLWLREGEGAEQSIIHALQIADPHIMQLNDVIIFDFGDGNRFNRRIDAKTMTLNDGYWRVEEAKITDRDGKPLQLSQIDIPTTLTPDQIQENFAPPHTISFWDLRGFIRTAASTGFPTEKYVMYWNSLLAFPLLLITMIFISASFSLRYNRMGRTGILAFLAIIAGLGFYFINDLFYTLGSSQAFPSILAAWLPAGIFSLIGIVALLYQEDG
ncbi:MAG: LPS export ABC transporter permease LptG [Parvibaculales bacterium]